MTDLFDHWRQVRQTLQKPERVLWLFDLDGTLAPIAHHPASVKIPISVRRLLQKLVLRYPKRVGILSGRPIKQVKQKIGISGLLYGGAHGFELQGPGLRWQHRLSPARRKQLKALAREIRLGLANFPGTWLEDKRWTLSIHYRDVRRQDRTRAARYIRALCNLAHRQGFKVQEGLMAADIFSTPGWNKGWAVRWLKRRLRLSHVFYAGDDVTDETVFRALGHADVTVHVGPSKTSAAIYRMAAPSECIRLLKRIIAL